MKKNILLIGVGGTGSSAVDTFFKKFHELGNQTDNHVSAIVFDTDAGDLKKIEAAKTVVMADNASVGTICDRIGKKYLKEWFPCEAKDVRAQEMVRGASQWRKKSYLAFLNLMNKPAARATFISALEEMTADPGASCEVYVVTSVAGGTGSGSFIPIALYAKRYLRKNLGKDPIVNAMIALPDIFADSQTPENRVKVYSNAYAILRELNAINLVSRNYNAGLTAKKKAPVNFRIGHPDEPNVGLLFDASDKRFWTPEAAPFSQVFLLDRIPGLNSVAAHNMVLANCLYTMLCTDVGSAFDSEFSNHELVRSQNNGSNAIYAGISTSQIRFPKESVLEYLAFKKTLASCDGEWLTLHQAVENTIRTKENEAKAARRRYVMKDGEYAALLLEALRNKREENCDELDYIVSRSSTRKDENGDTKNSNPGKIFFAEIEKIVDSKLPKSDTAKNDATRDIPKKKNPNLDAKKFCSTAQSKVYPTIMAYYKKCVEVIRSVPVVTADSVLTFDKKKIKSVGDKYSVVKNVLMTSGGKYVHPVAALIFLCQLRAEITAKLNDLGTDLEWDELKQRETTSLPAMFTSINSSINVSGSAYASLGKNRFAIITRDPKNYLGKKSKLLNDFNLLKHDAEKIIDNIYFASDSLVRYKLYTAIAENLDKLIEKYRSFFNRFEKEKESLVEQTADALRKDAGAIDSVINVYSTKDDKISIAALMDNGGTPETESDVLATDDVVGKGVLDAVMAAAIAECSNDQNYNDNDSSAYNDLFACMVKAYRESISKSETFMMLNEYNAIEAIVASCGDNAPDKKIDDALRSAFSVAQELAIPSLRLEPNKEEIDLVTPSRITVFMISKNTARYIKKNAEKFKLHLPADQNNENDVLKACAEAFLHDYSGNTSARVAIVESVPDHILYCTGEIMDITPLCIAKFNELGEDNTYFKNYKDALARYEKYDTDMWNPHIGNDLYKRGYLPYMNPQMENECDEKMVKALLYAFQKEHIRYTDTAGAARFTQPCFVCGQARITHNGESITSKNISLLLAWMRNQEEKIEKWSAEFDKEINAQMAKLPGIVSDNERAALEQAITKTPFMRMLNELLYVDPTENSQKLSPDRKWVAKTGPSAVEFAYIIKSSEEAARDCDDAERIIRVLYKIFIKMICYRVPPETYPDSFINVYKQQLDKFYQALASIECVVKAEKNCKVRFNSLVDWINSAGLFLDVNPVFPLDQNKELNLNERFNIGQSGAAAVLKDIERGKTDSKNAETTEDEDEATEVATESEEPADESVISEEAPENN